jgi:hypothetical protein
MIYTKNITNKLKNLDFEFSYEYHQKNLGYEFGWDFKEDLHYEDWKKGCITITVNHTNRTVVFLIDSEDEYQLNSFETLVTLDKILN